MLNDASGDVNVITPEQKELTRITYAEAGGEPYGGKVGVASVIRNRALSDDFPNTYSGVINQKGQFAAVGGKLWNQFDTAGNYIGPSAAAYRDSLLAARMVDLGYVRDPTGGALFFQSGPVTGWFQAAIQAGRLQPTWAVPPPPLPPVFTFYR